MEVIVQAGVGQDHQQISVRLRRIPGLRIEIWGTSSS
jgi:hypothetical protein